MSALFKVNCLSHILLIFSCFFYVSNSLTVSTSLSESDRSRFKSLFERTLLDQKNVRSSSLAVEGLKELLGSVGVGREVCTIMKKSCENGKDIEEVYRGCLGLSKLGGECEKQKDGVSSSVLSLLEVSNARDMEGLYQIILTRVTLGLETDASKVKTSMNSLMKGGALDQAYGNMIAVNIFKNKDDLKKYWVDIEDTLQQADEADGVHLYYEGGVITTARIVTSILSLTDIYGEMQSSLLKGDKVVKLASFLISRKHTHNLAAVVELIKALKALSNNKFSVPLVLSAIDNGVIDRHSPRLILSVSTVWGDKVSELDLTAETVKNAQTGVTIITRKNAIASTLPGLYELDISSGNLDKGFYNIRLEIKANNTKFSQLTSSNIVAKVISDISVEQAEISIKERDQVAGALNYKLTMGSVLPEQLSINWHHRFEMKFLLKDDKLSFKAHQVFVKLTHVKTLQEIIFVAESDKSGSYKFVLDLEKSNKDFDNLSGNYDMQLIVGDSVIKNPIQWTFANIKLEMPSSPSTDDVSDSRRSVAGMKKTLTPNPRIGQGPSVAKEQIFHVFRPADKRAGDFISLVFTALCTVPPLLIMFILWGTIGINVSNLEVSLSSAMFHGGLAVIFSLYYCYWSYLDMFSTLRCLIPIGAVTAFFGNRVLRHVASLRQKV